MGIPNMNLIILVNEIFKLENIIKYLKGFDERKKNEEEVNGSGN